MLFLENWVLNLWNASETKMWAKWFLKAKLGNRMTPRLFAISIESIIVGDGMGWWTRGGGKGGVL